MAFTGNFYCNSFRQELLLGVHDFHASTGDSFYIALYDNTASLDASTTAYTTSGEVTGTGYTAGGLLLTPVTPSAGATSFADFADAEWAASTITARGALIYNSTPNTTSKSVTNPAICVIDFGSDRSSSATTFAVQFPTADVTNAIIRIT